MLILNCPVRSCSGTGNLFSSCSSVMRAAGSGWSSASLDARTRKLCGWPHAAMAAMAAGLGLPELISCTVCRILVPSNGPIAGVARAYLRVPTTAYIAWEVCKLRALSDSGTHLAAGLYVPAERRMCAMHVGNGIRLRASSSKRITPTAHTSAGFPPGSPLTNSGDM